MNSPTLHNILYEKLCSLSVSVDNNLLMEVRKTDDLTFNKKIKKLGLKNREPEIELARDSPKSFFCPLSLPTRPLFALCIPPLRLLICPLSLPYRPLFAPCIPPLRLLICPLLLPYRSLHVSLLWGYLPVLCRSLPVLCLLHLSLL